jgi:23S rRNA pseudouridine2605 synthase
VTSEGERLRAAKVTPLMTSKDATELEVVICEGKNRQIRRMMAAVGSSVQRLVRTAIDNLMLEGLKQGEWRYLTHEEINQLVRH